MINRYKQIIFSCVLSVFSFSAVYANTTIEELYISIEGDDKADGSISAPFASIERAMEEVRRIKNPAASSGVFRIA